MMKNMEQKQQVKIEQQQVKHQQLDDSVWSDQFGGSHVISPPRLEVYPVPADEVSGLLTFFFIFDNAPSPCKKPDDCLNPDEMNMVASSHS